MLIKMLKLAAGPNGHKHVGQTYEVSKAEGDALIKDKAAELVAGPPPAATAPDASPKNAAKHPHENASHNPDKH